ncbi:hypothetical protein HMPREF9418_1564 [Neisseria macacae ATCC 33926]|uniref:Uncharacterized protein n=1 Tax=Neisseria macacae ATCC 33926 TaxID=997348 RepID=A0AA36XKE1_9NEIS|nr:hypothetical protein HMPREF9418_1564 [Neisseria macacae ATCC 33926]
MCRDTCSGSCFSDDLNPFRGRLKYLSLNNLIFGGDAWLLSAEVDLD